MSDWKRQTKEVSMGDLAAETAAAFQNHIEKYNLGAILLDALMCVQTDSEKIKKGLFGRSEIVQMVVIAAPRWLVWSVSQPNKDPVVLSAQLIHVTVQDYTQTSFVKLVPDSGIEVSGMFKGASEAVSAFIGLDEGAAGLKFRQVLISAAANAKK